MFLPLRHITALVLLFVSLVGVLTISYLQLLDMDRILVEVDHCAVNCTIIVGSRCLSCSELTKKNWRTKRSPSSQSLGKDHHFYAEETSITGCRKLTPCLEQCSSGLVNICLEPDRRSEKEYIGDEPLCEVEVPQVMGHAGGDPVHACENTIESSTMGIDLRMDAVHLDISVSKDMKLFLWRDHDPRSLTSRLRQMGSYGVAGCRPALVPGTVQPAHLLFWETIESSWFYVNTTSGLPADHQMITFEEWLQEMKYQLHSLTKIWLEFRMPREYLRSSILSVWSLAKQFGIEQKLFFRVKNGEVIFPNPITMIGGVDISYISLHKLSTSQWNSMVHILEEVQKEDPNDKVFILNREDEVVYALMVEKISKQSSVLSQKLKSVLDTRLLNLRGINFQVHSMESLVENVKTIVRSRDKITRDTCNPNYSQVAAWTVNSDVISERLVCLHIDYIITDYPGRTNINVNCAHLNTKGRTQGECPEFCPRVYQPVCGSDGKTYSNSCMLRFHSCEKAIHITLKHDGKCDDVQTENYDRYRSKSKGVKYLEYQLEERKASNLLENDKYMTRFTEEPKEDSLVCDLSFCEGVQAYEPVCGEDDVTYDSKCALLQTRCTGKKVEIKHVGPCQRRPCEEICSEVEDPVCGTDRKSYLNRCTLDRSICLDGEDGDLLHLWHRGRCGNCNFICTREFVPVCGSDGRSYPNLCSMEAETCRRDHPVWLVHEGECPKDREIKDTDHIHQTDPIKYMEKPASLDDDIEQMFSSLDNEFSLLQEKDDHGDFYMKKMGSSDYVESQVFENEPSHYHRGDQHHHEPLDHYTPENYGETERRVSQELKESPENIPVYESGRVNLIEASNREAPKYSNIEHQVDQQGRYDPGESLVGEGRYTFHQHPKRAKPVKFEDFLTLIHQDEKLVQTEYDEKIFDYEYHVKANRNSGLLS